MSNVLQFLESLGRNPRPLSADEFTAAVANADLAPAARNALLERDVEALNRELGGRGFMLCLIYPADNDEQPGDEAPAGDEEIPGEESASRAA